MKLIKTITALIAISLFGASYANAGSHAYTGPDLSGEKLTIFGPWLAPESHMVREQKNYVRTVVLLDIF